MNLTQEEKDLLFKIATLVGCDSDGDTLTIFINQQANVVELIS